MRTVMLVLMMVLATTSMSVAGNIHGEYESRTSTDKINIWYRTSHLEVFVLKNANLKIAIGPRFKFGPLTVTTKIGGDWRVADSTVNGNGSVNLFFRQGRFTCLSVNDFNLEKISFNNVFQEGFVLVDVPEITDGFSMGMNFEHYHINNVQKWVFGPRVDLKLGSGSLNKISLWAGITDNPTAAVLLHFKIPM
ncbi:MAG: hypothetical protein ACNFW9_05000 [Candidatus Kerfeldbacteria bacterium]